MHYFVYKNGSANAWRRFTDAYVDTKGRRHLYVGFGDVFEEIERNGGKAEPLERARRIAGLKGDLLHILVASHTVNRDKFLLLEFDPRSLRFWKVAGEVELPHGRL